MLLWDGGGGRAFGFEGWCLILDFVMCRRGAPAALVGCSVGVEGSFAARTVGAVA